MIDKKLIIGENLTFDMKIYRYMSLKEFLFFVEFNKIVLTRVSSWEDTWEAPTLKLPVQFGDEKLIFRNYSVVSNLFAQCWTTKKESDAMWRIYSPTKDGIKVGTSIKKFELIQGVNYYAIGKIHYYDKLQDALNFNNELNKLRPMLYDALIKREEFSHEEEVRLITFHAPNNTLDCKQIDDKENHLELNVNVNEFIEEIVIDPRAATYYVDVIKSYCEKSGIKVNPQKSDLYTDDIFNNTKLIRKYISVDTV
ncbi:MAG: DUF2971 domain-containing protein [Clostridium sp.]|uniref:DUF2971 domain-containing protein n=1 Tax=Anaerorhabdus sp. TaxID=1872524 RepID=UPI002FC685AF